MLLHKPAPGTALLLRQGGVPNRRRAGYASPASRNRTLLRYLTLMTASPREQGISIILYMGI